jgi:hypothetical protein
MRNRRVIGVAAAFALLTALGVWALWRVAPSVTFARGAGGYSVRLGWNFTPLLEASGLPPGKYESLILPVLNALPLLEASGPPTGRYEGLILPEAKPITDDVKFFEIPQPAHPIQGDVMTLQRP